MTILYFLIALGLLIFIHELGHFLVAKRNGIGVEAFSLGFGPRLIGIKRGETDYRISGLPLGGYVRMVGEDPEDDRAHDPRAFSAKSAWVRAKVVAAGPIMNLLLCLLLMPIVFLIGRPEPVYLSEAPVLMGVRSESPAAATDLRAGDRVVAVDGDAVERWEEVVNAILLAPGNELAVTVERDGAPHTVTATVGELPGIRGGYLGIEPIFFLGNEATVETVRPNGPADAAGIEEGDRIVRFAGAPVIDWIDLTEKVDAQGGEAASIVVMRDGEEIALTVQPEYDEAHERWLIGISRDRLGDVPMHVRRYGLFGAIGAGMREVGKLMCLTFSVLGRLVTLQLSYKVLGGPIIIAKTSAAAAASGLASFLYFIAFLSLQLAILNVLPIPVLDGGHLVFLGIEGVRRRPLSDRVRGVANQVGFVLLIALMLVVTINDIENIWGVSAWIRKLF